MSDKLIRVQKRQLDDKLNINTRKGGFINSLCTCLGFLIYLTFTILTILFLLNQVPQNTTFFNNYSIKKYIDPNSDSPVTLTKADIGNDISKRLTKIFNSGSGVPDNRLYMAISQIRISFVIIYN